MKITIRVSEKESNLVKNDLVGFTQIEQSYTECEVELFGSRHEILPALKRVAGILTYSHLYDPSEIDVYDSINDMVVIEKYMPEFDGIEWHETYSEFIKRAYARNNFKELYAYLNFLQGGWGHENGIKVFQDSLRHLGLSQAIFYTSRRKFSALFFMKNPYTQFLSRSANWEYLYKIRVLLNSVKLINRNCIKTVK